ncbi:MAG TPA: hypothetical protein VI434_01040 [Candidatus Dormibacteraeota bacterium]
MSRHRNNPRVLRHLRYRRHLHGPVFSAGYMFPELPASGAGSVVITLSQNAAAYKPSLQARRQGHGDHHDHGHGGASCPGAG